MTKEVFIQQFEKEFTVYEQVQLIKKYLQEQNYDFLKDDLLQKKYLEINIYVQNLAQILEDNFSNEKVFILNDKYLVTRTQETTHTTTPKDIITFLLFDLQKIGYWLATKTRLISDNTITYKNYNYGLVRDLVWTEDTNLVSEIRYYDESNDNIIFELGINNPETDAPYSEFYIDKTSVELYNGYWTLSMDLDQMHLTCDVEKGMGITGSTYQTDTQIKMYAGDNTIEITSDEGNEIAGNNNRIIATGLTGYRKFNRFEVRQDGIYINNRCMYKQVEIDLDSLPIEDEDDLYKYVSINLGSYGGATSLKGIYITTNLGSGDYHIYRPSTEGASMEIWSLEENINIISDNHPFSYIAIGGDYNEYPDNGLSIKIYKNDNEIISPTSPAFPSGTKLVLEFEPCSCNPSTLFAEY